MFRAKLDLAAPPPQPLELDVDEIRVRAGSAVDIVLRDAAGRRVRVHRSGPDADAIADLMETGNFTRTPMSQQVLELVASQGAEELPQGTVAPRRLEDRPEAAARRQREERRRREAATAEEAGARPADTT